MTDTAAMLVYFFGDGSADGAAGMRNLLGGKGANLAEMASIGLPVPPGFTITTEVCTSYYDNDRRLPDGLDEQVAAALGRVGEAVGTRFGDQVNPLLVSVRSFYHRQSRHALPLDWSTTTDSISAALAIETDADELVILKSCEVDAAADATTLAEQGIVDPAFPRAASRVKSIRIEKLPHSSLS